MFKTYQDKMKEETDIYIYICIMCCAKQFEYFFQNWFGEVVTEDNKDYLIKNPKYKLKPNTPLLIRFYIKYDTRDPPPQIVTFRLNARTICPEGGTTTEATTIGGQLLTSATKAPPTPPPQPPPRPSSSGSL